jgi:hypothetical protein
VLHRDTRSSRELAQVAQRAAVVVGGRHQQFVHFAPAGEEQLTHRLASLDLVAAEITT